MNLKGRPAYLLQINNPQSSILNPETTNRRWVLVVGERAIKPLRIVAGRHIRIPEGNKIGEGAIPIGWGTETEAPPRV
jgi:hypothetical protein